MFQRTDDLRITQVRPLLAPAILLEEIPISDRASNVVANTRQAIGEVLEGRDPRLVVVAGPCSIHDPKAALEYAERLQQLAEPYGQHLIIVMRTYFEKPRTSVGWKGLINDPDLDESFHINKGLRLARKLLLDVNDLGLPTASEFLDTQIPQHIADLVSWVAIGARTTESQVHRELASGLSMPVGFKNGTDGGDPDGRRRGPVGSVAAPVPLGDQAGRLGDLPDDRKRHLPCDSAGRQPHRAQLRRRARGRGMRDAASTGSAREGDDRLFARQQPEEPPPSARRRRLGRRAGRRRARRGSSA